MYYTMPGGVKAKHAVVAVDICSVVVAVDICAQGIRF